MTSTYFPTHELGLAGDRLVQEGTTGGRFADPEQGIFDTANHVGLSGALAGARADTDRAFDQAARALDRRNRALGIQLTDRQEKSQARRMGLRRALAKAQSAESTRGGFQARGEQAARAAGSFEDFLTGVRFSELDSRGRLSSKEQLDAKRREAAEEQARSGLVGSLVGMGLQFVPGLGAFG